VTLGYDPKAGKPIRKFFYGRTRQEVAEKLTRILRDHHLGLLPATKERMEFGSWLWTFLDLYKKPEIRPSTYELYAGILRLHLPEKLAHTPLEKLRSEDLQALYTSLGEKGYSRTVQILHNLIHSALDQAVKLGYVPRNVSEATTRPKGKKKEVQILTPQELKRFLEVAKKHRLFPAFYVLATTGLRRGELLGLKWQDIDWEHGTLTVQRNLVWVGGEPALQEPKTKGSYRTIPLPENTLEVLKEWRKKWLEERVKLGPDWPETDLVFPSEAHTAIYPRNFLRTFKSLLQEANLPMVSLHALRHSYATMLLMEGENPRVVQEILGHSAVTTTLGIYSKVLPSLKQQAVGKIERILGRNNV
jgi:integrase